VSDPTVRGIQTAGRISRLIDELKLDIGERVLIINRISGNEAETLEGIAADAGLYLAGTIPNDPNIFEYDLKGRPLYELPPESRSVISLFGILDTLHVP